MDTKREEKEPRPWTLKQTKLLISVRLKYEDEVLSGELKKYSLWYKIWSEIRNIDTEFPFTRIEMHRKFNNLLLTYRRINQRYSESGRYDAIKWDYYNLFHSAYGTKQLNKPAPDLLMSTLEPESEVNIPTEEEFGTNVNKNKKIRASQTNSNNEILKFFKKEAIQEERRHQELLKVETERIEVLKSVKDLLERIMLSSGIDPCKQMTNESQSTEVKGQSTKMTTRKRNQYIIQEVTENEELPDFQDQCSLSYETEAILPRESVSQDTDIEYEFLSIPLPETVKIEKTNENIQIGTEKSTPNIIKRKQQSSDEEEFSGFGECNGRFKTIPCKKKMVKEEILSTEELEEEELYNIEREEKQETDDIPDIKQEVTLTENNVKSSGGSL